MSEIFGIDIAQIVSDAFDGQLVPITLTRKVQSGTYDPLDDRYEDSNTDEVASTETTYTSEGIMPGSSRISAFQAFLSEVGQTKENERHVLIIAKKLGTDPQIDDKLTIESNTYPITGIEGRDPAKATWIVKVEI